MLERIQDDFGILVWLVSLIFSLLLMAALPYRVARRGLQEHLHWVIWLAIPPAMLIVLAKSGLWTNLPTYTPQALAFVQFLLAVEFHRRVGELGKFFSDLAAALMASRPSVYFERNWRGKV